MTVDYLTAIERVNQDNHTPLVKVLRSIAQGERVPTAEVQELLKQCGAVATILSDYALDESMLEDSDSPAGGFNHDSYARSLTAVADMVCVAQVALESHEGEQS